MKDNRDEVFKKAFDALPSMIFVVDQDIRIQEYNKAASEMLLNMKEQVLRQRAGNILHCVNAMTSIGGCGTGPHCVNCVIRNSVKDVFGGNRVVRRRSRIEIANDGTIREIFALITASPFNFQGVDLALLIIEDISEIADIQRIITICSVCRKVQDEKEAWMRIESYFRSNWDVDFSHSYCPECLAIELKKMQNMKD